MSISKGDPEAFVRAGWWARLRLLKASFLILMGLGLIFLGIVLVYTTIELILPELGPVSSLATPAFAQTIGTAPTDPSQVSPRVVVMWGVLFVLGIVYLSSVYRILFSKNLRNIENASDRVKTLTGFFVGTATKLA